jgi:hypothetical protein
MRAAVPLRVVLLHQLDVRVVDQVPWFAESGTRARRARSGWRSGAARHKTKGASACNAASSPWLHARNKSVTSCEEEAKRRQNHG